MLEILRIRDLALIEDLEMEFAPGMNVLTGETGAGKSFILKALQFLTGERLGPDLVRPGKERAVVEALFVVNGEERILRRELSAETGRSRLYINDQLSSQDTVREMRGALLLHTSQHGQQKLLQPAYQSAVLDGFMHRPELLRERDDLVRRLSENAGRLQELETRARSLEEKRDVLEYQQAEIDKVGPGPGEEEELESRRAAFRNQAGVARAAAQALEALRGGDDGPGLYAELARLERAMGGLAKVMDEFREEPGALLETHSFFRDMEARVQRVAAHSAQDADIEQIEARLYALAQLKRRLKRPLDAILRLQEEIAENLAFLDTCALERKRFRQEETALCDALAGVLGRLNAARKKAARALSVALRDELTHLGFSEHVEVLFEFSPFRLHPERDDCVELRPRMLWRPNPGQPPQPLDRIASGGELSRFLLALVTLMSRGIKETPTLIFDEVDAGVGGLTLNRVAESLAGLAGERQMLLITHWPQLAARAGRHFLVDKQVRQGETFTVCRRLGRDEISQELARMAGGGEQGSALARELV